VPGLPLPPALDNPPCPTVGLTIEAEALMEMRRHRLHTIGAVGSGGAGQNFNEYVDLDKVREELQWARRLCMKRGWPVVDVTRRSIEETAAAVMRHMEAWRARHRRQQSQAVDKTAEHR
jgi:regulator of PEP synthase PpsR (kinase-PPPase family)